MTRRPQTSLALAGALRTAGVRLSRPQPAAPAGERCRLHNSLGCRKCELMWQEAKKQLRREVAADARRKAKLA